MTSPAEKDKADTPWRFVLFFVLLLPGWAAGIVMIGWSKGLMAGFDLAAMVFLAAHVPVFRHDARTLRQSAARNDANRTMLLVISFLLTVVILSAIVAELALGPTLSLFDKLLVTVSLVIVWVFGNAVYTLHYAHLYYTGKVGGLEFPATEDPLMADFVYFAFTLGVAVQTSDVIVRSRNIRKVVTAHCVAGFFFNLGVLALTINVLGSR